MKKITIIFKSDDKILIKVLKKLFKLNINIDLEIEKIEPINFEINSVGTDVVAYSYQGKRIDLDK